MHKFINEEHRKPTFDGSSDGANILRLEEMSDFLRATMHTDDLFADASTTHDDVAEVLLLVVDANDYDVVIDETRIAGSKGMSGT